jgi:energy-coupling factor transport system ATP-binding protein
LFIQIEHLSYRHPGIEADAPSALEDVSINIAEGEWVALIGANGSGKTTLARNINALLLPTSGRVLINGLDTQLSTNFAAIRSTVGMVFQSPEDQIVASLVMEDTAFGLENLALPSHEIRERVEQALKLVGMWEMRERPPHLLSAGQVQRVALAGVLAMRPCCIVFDETTAMLDPRGRQEVLAQMQALHDQGITIVEITHSMDEAALAERVILLNKGRLVAEGLPGQIFQDEALLHQCHLNPPVKDQILKSIQRYFSLTIPPSASLDEAFDQIPENHALLRGKAGSKNEPLAERKAVIEIESLRHRYMAGTPFESESLRDVSLTAYSQSTHGIVGATGSGKSTLLQHLNGLYLPQSGKVHVGSFHLEEPGVDIRALRRYAGYVFQNPETSFFEQYVGDEIAYGARNLHGREGLRERVREAMTTVGLDFDEFKDRMTITLSGGEKRKVALACALAMQPGLLILDEPSAGLDPFSRDNLLKTLKGLQHGGVDIVLSSHNMSDIAELAQQVTLLDHGKSLSTGSVGETFNDAELMQSAGLIQPASVAYAQALRSKGWPIPVHDVTMDSVNRTLSNLVEGGAK